MLFIGICGASGSGKTTLAEELVQAVGASSVVIKQDAYYFDHRELSFDQRARLNFDEPKIFDHDLLLQDVQALLNDKATTRKGYDFTQHARCDSDEIVYPGDVLILEGIHAFYDPRLRDLMYLKLFINVEPDICLLRRIVRDIKERERSIDSIAEQYLATVKPMYDKYIRNYIQYADVIVTRGGKNARIVDILAGYLRDALYD
ncbi:MAG: uridine kinase [Eubacteriales bacterium]|jgi:uridine kinase|nr:uridine kinase [Eubacteriales bacterium]MDD3109376.1 uridine kinase [Eubacteriales bacterium]MDD3572279.1 uridine kinase [Eubacteriales bacterium]MDD4133906.1 uridine kinase [Eubacteriales bacterium]NLO14260.1 uridine kinase [Clostridiales bacterium]